MTINIPLSAGQYQIGNLKFGRGTVYPVNSVEIQGHEINAQDAQLLRSDELQFGFDSFKPAPIIFELGVLDFRAIPNIAGMVGSSSFGDSAMQYAAERFAQAWRGDDVRTAWGEMMPLRYCDRDGNTKIWYGRPRKIQISKATRKSNFYTIHAEFQRADTLVYGEAESAIEIMRSASPTYAVRALAEGFSPAWLRIIGYGPLTHPIITIGNQQVELDITVADGEAFEVNSYPWSRRCIKSDGTNISAKLIGATQYLDQLVIPAMDITPVRWTSQELSTMIPYLGNQEWSETIQDIRTTTVPNTFTIIHGKPVVRFDLFNFGGSGWPWQWLTPSRYITSGVFSNTAALVYTQKQYATADQFCEAQLVEPVAGRSAIGIMCKPDMSSFCFVEVTTGINNNYLKIRNGTGWGSYSTVRASWQNTGNWSESDKVAIGFDSATKKYSAYLNGIEKCSWTDSGVIVPTGSNYRNACFIMDMDGNLVTRGVGFKNIVCYDKATVPSPTGRIFLLWRNSHPMMAG